MERAERDSLLRHAAAAGGIEKLSISKGWAVHADRGQKLLSRWNPLEELADAMDLAIRCKVQLDIRTLVVTCEPMGVTPGKAVVVPCKDDYESRKEATMLAVVKCVAQMEYDRQSAGG